jgi:hypothetical protein
MHLVIAGHAQPRATICQAGATVVTLVLLLPIAAGLKAQTRTTCGPTRPLVGVIEASLGVHQCPNLSAVSKSLFTMQFQQRDDAEDAAARPNAVASETSWLPLTAALMEDCVAVREEDVTLGPVPARNCKRLRPAGLAAALAGWLAGVLAAGGLAGLLAARDSVGFRTWLIPWMTICGWQPQGMGGSSAWW